MRTTPTIQEYGLRHEEDDDNNEEREEESATERDETDAEVEDEAEKYGVFSKQ